MFRGRRREYEEMRLETSDSYGVRLRGHIETGRIRETEEY